jgi:hypothetical protein
MVVGVAQVAVPAAYILAGVSLIVYGLLFVDVDSASRSRR